MWVAKSGMRTHAQSGFTKMGEESSWRSYVCVLQVLLLGGLVIGILWVKISCNRISVEFEELKKKVSSHGIDGSGFEKIDINDAFYHTLLNANSMMSDLDSRLPGDSTMRSRRSSEAESLAETLTRAFMTAMKTLCAPDEKYCLPGPKGNKGETGTSGQPGFPGYAGGPGLPGIKGERGLKGAKGEAGEEGRDGKPGQPGVRGDIGPKGETGLTGDQGPSGATGSPGLKGEVGQNGLKGAKGSKGDNGSSGPRGPAGATGLQGKKGEAGRHGQPGQSGNPGEKGSKGDKGSKGLTEKGSKGEPGLGIPGVQGDNGPMGPKGAKGMDGLPGFPGPKGEKGKKGEKGLQGARGPAGMTGAEGQRGEIGEKGWKGDKGSHGGLGPKGQKGETGLLPRSALPAQCSNHRILDEAWRRVSNTAQTRRDDTTNSCSDPSGLTDGWYRYERRGTVQRMLDTCPLGTPYICGTDWPGWLQGEHPRVIGKEVQRTVCFHYNGNCCFDRVNIKVINCQSYYVYYLTPFSYPTCNRVYCFEG